MLRKIENADLVSEGENSLDLCEVGDQGMITSVQGTPVKLQNQGKFQSQGKFQQSPIIARSAKKN